jgi:predicted choloylglycine hydrolase
MNRQKLSVSVIEGDAESCGFAYGRLLEPQILGFIAQEIKPAAELMGYARQCWRWVQRQAPRSAQVMRGLADGAALSIEQVVLLTLHEELVHLRAAQADGHCTGYVLSGSGTRDGRTLVGQNWDWSAALFPWAGLLRWRQRGAPASVLYHYPGLWSCAGVNDAGLALMWTGSGYLPPVAPRAGVPTYVLIAELLRCRTVEQALDRLGQLRQAGCFIFMLGDAAGRTAVVEGLNGRMAVQRDAAVCSRGNHYQDPGITRGAKQAIPTRRGVTTGYRTARMAQLVAKQTGRCTPRSARQMLLDRDGPGPWIHQFPPDIDRPPSPAMTIDSMLAVCQDRALWTCRGGREPGPWQKLVAR